MIEQLLKEIKEDKKDNLTTTSFKFKRDMWDFFQNYKDKTAVEFGTHKGQTTRIMSFLFKKVYTININDNLEAKTLNKDRDNIEYLNFNLYTDNPLPINDKIDVFFVDAGHLYNEVIHDINRILSMNISKECYIVFDDYGSHSTEDHVKKAIDESIENKIIEKIKGIGHSKGHNFGNKHKGGPERILGDFEGLITKIVDPQKRLHTHYIKTQGLFNDD